MTSLNHDAPDPGTEHRLRQLADRYGLERAARTQLECLLDSLVHDPRAPTSLREPNRAIDDHVADSLVALELLEVRGAAHVADIGAGAGLPGLPLAIAMPQTAFTLVESASRKCAYLNAVIAQCKIQNANVLHTRVESWNAGLCRFDLVTARALGSLPVVLEYLAPLLRLGGRVVVWRGRRDPDEEAAADRAAKELGLNPADVGHVRPYPEAQNRHLHVWSKVMETPDRFPRRPGMAAKRPLGAARD